MEKKSTIKVGGVLRIYNTETGELLREEKNLIVNAGKTFLRDILSNLATVPDAMSHTAVGSGSTAAAEGNTSLEAQIGDRMTAAVTEPAAYQVKYSATSSAGSHTGNWYEAGIFNAASAGTMLCRIVFGLLTKAAGDAFTLEYTVTFYDYSE